MAPKVCTCSGGKPAGDCPDCRDGAILPYWCEVCRRRVADKRCPLCGLKARKLRGEHL